MSTLKIPKTCEYFTLYGERARAGMIKLSLLNWGEYPELFRWARYYH